MRNPASRRRKKGSGDIAEILLGAGADPRAELSDSRTPAAVAKTHNHESLAQLLRVAEKLYGKSNQPP